MSMQFSGQIWSDLRNWAKTCIAYYLEKKSLRQVYEAAYAAYWFEGLYDAA